MKKFALVTSIAGVVCIVLGVIVVTVSAVAGATLPRSLRDGMIHRHNGWDWEDYWEENWDETQECSLDGITELTADVGAGSFFIREGDTDRLTLRIRDPRGTASFQEDGSRLSIDGGEMGSGRGLMENGLRRWLEGRGDESCTVEVTVPAGYRFDAVSLDLGAGYLEADAVRAGEVDLDTGAGYGDIRVLEADWLNADVGVGYLNIDQADIASGVDAECGVGSLELGILGSREDFSYEVDCERGEVTLDGESHSGQFECRDGGLGFPAGTGGKQMRLSCGVGNIDISFEG